jgi:hypothetical protein
VSKGKILGCLVSVRGIKANPEKIDAIINMEPPTSRKLAQRLTGRLATLNRFISRSAERGFPFFEVLKNIDPFSWGPTQQNAFDELKTYLHNLTTIASPQPKEPLLLYVAASPHVVNAVLVTEKQEEHVKRKLPVHYISETLNSAKKFYTEMEKVAYAVVMASKKLKHYFQAHKIIIPSSFPLDNIFKNPEAIGRIGKWETEINDFTIEFVGRHNQILGPHGFCSQLDPQHS